MIAPEEWDFSESRVGDDELCACYYYEFSRAKPELYQPIGEWRKAQPEIEKAADVWREWVQIKRLNPLIRYDPVIHRVFKPRGMSALAEMPASLHRFGGWLVYFLLAFPEFHQRTWQALPDDERKANWARFLKRPSLEDLENEQYHRALDDISDFISYSRETRKPLQDIIRELDESSTPWIRSYLFAVSWRRTDPELLAAFKGWLKDRRSKDSGTVQRKQTRLSAEWKVLPTMMRTGLHCLGVHRRKRRRTWAEFMAAWPHSYQHAKKSTS